MNAPWPDIARDTLPAFDRPARLHAWRAYPYRHPAAPQSGFYAVGHRTVFLRRGAYFPPSHT